MRITELDHDKAELGSCIEPENLREHGVTVANYVITATPIIGAGTGPAGPAMAGPFSAEFET